MNINDVSLDAFDDAVTNHLNGMYESQYDDMDDEPIKSVKKVRSVKQVELTEDKELELPF